MKIDRVRLFLPTGIKDYEVGNKIDYVGGIESNNADNPKVTIAAIEVSPTSEIILMCGGGFVVVFGAVPFVLYGSPDDTQIKRSEKAKKNK
jgi:hypothetical protein